jgi:hypothetical protein
MLCQVVEEHEAGHHHHHEHDDHHAHEHDHHHAEEPAAAAHAHGHDHAHKHAHAHSEHGHAHGHAGHDHGHGGHDHKHDDSVTSVSLELDGFLDLDKVRRQIRHSSSHAQRRPCAPSSCVKQIEAGTAESMQPGALMVP